MLQISIEIDDDPWNLSPQYLEGLDWDSVTKDQMDRMPLDFLRHKCPVNSLDQRDFSTVPYDVVWNIIRDNIKMINFKKGTYYYDMIVGHLLSTWCSLDFAEKYYLPIRRLLKDMHLHPRIHTAFVQLGIMNINEFNCEMTALPQHVLVSTKISEQDLANFLFNTNYLYNQYLYNYSRSDSVIPLSISTLEGLRLPAPKYKIDKQEVRYLNISTEQLLPQEIYWDDMVQMYRNGSIDNVTLGYIWEDIFNEYPELIDDSKLKKENFYLAHKSEEYTLWNPYK